MKKFITILALITLAACGNDQPPQVQYQQPPVVVQQAPAPAQAPVVVQQSDNTGTALVAGAALGAVATMALSDRDRGYQSGYDNRPAVQQNVTHVTQVNKTVIVNKTVNPVADTKTPPTAVTPAPIAPAPAAIKPNYAAGGTSSPAPTMTAAALTAPKTLTMPATPVSASNYKPVTYAPVTYKQPAALPAPKVSLTKPTVSATPRPTASYGYKALTYKK